MKKIVLLISIIYCLKCFAQNPNPNLFQTWYLQSVQAGDFTPLLFVSTVTPAVAPTLTIANTLTFTGIGVCNTFNGTFTSTQPNQFSTTLFNQTLLICSSQSQNNLEGSYFSLMQNAVQYNIYQQGAGLILVINNLLFGQATFQNFPLQTTDFDLEKIAIYPNPSNGELFLSLNTVPISKISIINTIGQTVKTINKNFDVINIAALTAGIYILKIDTEFGTISRKIMKQ